MMLWQVYYADGWWWCDNLWFHLLLRTSWSLQGFIHSERTHNIWEFFNRFTLNTHSIRKGDFVTRTSHFALIDASHFDKLDWLSAVSNVVSKHLALKYMDMYSPGQHTKTVGDLLGGCFGLRLVYTWPSNDLAFFRLRVFSARPPTRPSSRRSTRSIRFLALKPICLRFAY